MYEEKAAGGVVFRRCNGQVEVLIIKDRYGKWALPKGKLEPGETVEDAGLREIFEETGIKGEIVAPLLTINYQYIHAVKGTVDKAVTYFLVKAFSERIAPQDEEVSEAQWVTLQEAIDTCEYPNNLEVLTTAITLLQ